MTTTMPTRLGKYSAPGHEIEHLDQSTQILKNTAAIVSVSERHRRGSAGTPFGDVGSSIDNRLTSFGHHPRSSELSRSCDVCDRFS